MNENKESWIKDFTYIELSDREAANAILNFVMDFDIRCGEYEGNLYVIKKLNRDNFIIMLEYQHPEGDADFPWANVIYKKELEKIIEKHI